MLHELVSQISTSLSLFAPFFARQTFQQTDNNKNSTNKPHRSQIPKVFLILENDIFMLSPRFWNLAAGICSHLPRR